MEILSNKEFDILVDIENTQNTIFNKETLSKRVYTSIDSVNDTIEKLNALGYIEFSQNKITVSEKGYGYLKPYRVKRAILLAAGLGSRMQPVTLETPKPLVEVNGKIIIETLIAALLAKEIEDITIVTGYLEHKFAIIKEKYPMVKFVYNDRYEKENNISSAMLVKNLYANSYVMDADLLLKNDDIIRKYERYSNYLGIWVDDTDDWRLEITDGKVTNMLQGGRDTYLMVGLSYWSEEDGRIFADDIQELYSRKDGKQKYWDDVVLTEYNEHYDITVRECVYSDITEIDSIYELAEIDKSYKKYID